MKGKVREAAGEVQNSVLIFAHMKLTTRMEEPEQGVFEIDFLPASQLPSGVSGKVYFLFNP
ncbi:MAG: hypothetical protein NWE82_02975 [Candidatus Bathyarchaeota archaeon]|nr:hypothetical protein [Candidatus Bathyarchaeota archaeon]